MLFNTDPDTISCSDAACHNKLKWEDDTLLDYEASQQLST
jgi:hypothetical protein